MEEMGQKLKSVIFGFFKAHFKIILIIFIIVCILTASLYFITIDDAEWKDDDLSSTNFGVGQYINDVTVKDDGTISGGMTAKELWDKLIENGSRVDQYLDTPEELARLMKAEMVTKYPDLREKPDKRINWDEIIRDPDKIQGIIKFIRSDENNQKTTMSYVDPEEFQGYLDEYNRSGSEKSKKDALTHFTLKKSSNSSTSGSSNQNGSIAAGEGAMTDVSQAIIDASNSTGWPGVNWCAKWVDDVYDNAGLNACRHATAYEASVHHIISTDMSAIPVGAAVYGTGRNSSGAGHVGIYIGGRQVVDSQSSGVVVSDIETWVSWQSDVIDGKQGWLGWGWSDNNRIRGTTEDPNLSQNNNEDKNEDKDDNKDENKNPTGEKDVLGDGYSQEYTSSAGITYKHYKQYEGSYAENPYWEGTIHTDGCGPTSVAILASGLTDFNYTPADIAQSMMDRSGFTGPEPLKEEMNSIGLASEIIQNPTGEVIQNNLRNGKVMLVSVNNQTIFTNQSHIMAIVDINSAGQVYVCNPGSGSLQGWYDVSEITKGCTYIVTTDAGAAGIAQSTTNGSDYVAVVATWRQINTTLTTNDPNVEEYDNAQYTMTTTNINYEEMVSPYTMPFDLLWAFLVVGEDKELVFELADLAYNSNIEITVYDNVTENTNINEWNYTQREKVIVNAIVKATYRDAQRIKTLNNDIHDPWEDKPPYVTTKTVTTKSNTINPVLTRANVWIVDYKNDYTYVGPTETNNTTSTVTQNETVYPSVPNKISYSDFSCDEITDIKEKAKREVIESALDTTPPESSAAGSGMPNTPIVEVTFLYVQHFYKYINIYDDVTNITSTQKYLKGDHKKPIEKTDEDTEPNFVTVFNKKENSEGRNKIKSVPKWLFEIIEINDSTKDMLDLIKYLLYKTSGRSYGVKEYDFSVFEPGKFNPIGGKGTVLSITKTNLKKEEFVRLVQGYSAAISKGYGTQVFRDNAGIIYDVCVSNNINPVLCAAQAWKEQNWDDPNTSAFNYWGIAVYNGQNYGSSYGSMEEAVQGYCNQINSQQLPDGSMYSTYLARAQEFATVDNRFKGDMSVIYDIFSAYAYIGDGHSLEEQANYAAEYVESLSECAEQIFGASAGVV